MASIFSNVSQDTGSVFQGGGTSGSIFGQKPDLKTSAGLLQYAETQGLGQQAQTKISTGENPHQIFSGGFVQDVFDVLNAPQSVIAGLASNQTPLDAIQNRTSFSDAEHLGKYGIKGKVAGILADIATDPLMLIPPLGIGKAIFRGIQGGGKMLQETKFTAPVADFVGKRLIYRYGQDPVYAKLANDAVKKINVGGWKLKELTKPITELSNVEQVIIANARKSGNIENLPKELLDKARPAFQELDRLGQEAVNVGLLKESVYRENVGKYIARLYTSKEAGKEGVVKSIFPTKPLRIDLNRFKARKDIPEEIRTAMGEIMTAGYPLARSLAQINQAVERTKFFGIVAEKWSVDALGEGLMEGMKQLPETARLGKLSGKFVPERIFADIQELNRPLDEAQQIGKKIITGFKFGKVILNLATHVRNIISNTILNDFSGLSPARLDIYAKAGHQIAAKGKIYEEAKGAGMALDTFWGNEIKALLTSAGEPALKTIPKAIVNKLGDVYQGEEEFAKMAQYIYQRGKGLSPEDAVKAAETATFNYAQVTPFVRRLRESLFGMPFITFALKATGRVGETLAVNPGKIGKYGFIKRGVESMSPQEQLAEERKTEPDYIKRGFYVRLPFGDKYERNLYFDATYILPFGDLISGTLISPTQKGEPVTQTLLSKFPVLNALGDLYQNKDFYGSEIVKSGSITPFEIGRDMFSYLAKFYGPPPFTDTPGRISQALQLSKMTPDEIGQKRTLTEEILRNFGLKVQPFKTDQQQRARERESREALQNLLRSEGKIKDFTIPFIPKSQ